MIRLPSFFILPCAQHVLVGNMSTSSIGLSVVAGDKKKRKHNFRPSPNKKKTAGTIQGLELEDAGSPTHFDPDSTAQSLAAGSSLPEEGIENESIHLDTRDESQELDQSKDAAVRTTGISSGIPRVLAPRRKRKTTVLAVGVSRGESTNPSSTSTALVLVDPTDDAHALPGTDDYETAEMSLADESNERDGLHPSKAKSPPSHMPLELVPPVIPEDTSGKPKLFSFCSSYPKPKKPKESKATGPLNVAGAATGTAERAVARTDASIQPLPQPPQQHAGPVVQIVNGEIVLQESSIIFHGAGATTGTTVEGADASAAATFDNALTEVVEEEAELAIVGATYTSFATGRRARPPTSQWTVPETQLFYEALSQVGLDFGTMEAFFESHAATSPHIRKRLRRQLKNKYHAECIKNSALVERALKGRVGIDMAVFELTPEAIAEVQANRKKQQESKTAVEDESAVAPDALPAAEEALDEGEADCVEEDANAETAPSLLDASSTRNESEDAPFAWPDEADGEDEKGAESDSNAFNDTFDNSVTFDDPLFHEDHTPATALGETEPDARPTLVFGVPPKSTKKTTKPNFRSAARKRGIVKAK
jgi:Myb DNA-binding like